MSEKRELSRAEQVRARRSQRVTQALIQNTQRTVKTMNPVISRVGASYVQSKHKRVDGGRRFNIAFGLPDIRYHQPAIKMSRSRGSWRFASFLLTCLFGTAIYFMWTLAYFHVPAATILGNNRLSKEDIESVLGVTGESIFLVQAEEVATRLRLNYPELASAEANVYLPNHSLAARRWIYVDRRKRCGISSARTGEWINPGDWLGNSARRRFIFR